LPRSSNARGRAIVDYQRRELEQFLTDGRFLAANVRREHYSNIGTWPGARPGNRVLELGCGPGRYAAILSKLGCDVVAVDPHSFESWSLIEQHTPVRFVSPVRAEQLPFDNDSFDAVACLGALLYFEDPSRALAEIRRVLKTGGHLILRTVNRTNLFARVRRRPIDPATRQLYTMPELMHFAASHGFEVTDHFSYGVYSPVWPQFWWYLLNGVISVEMQERLSDLTPASLRTNHVLFAHKRG
jgi:ubiquinone/menaquinone biosynthesis C-methylase UbiE